LYEPILFGNELIYHEMI